MQIETKVDRVGRVLFQSNNVLFVSPTNGYYWSNRAHADYEALEAAAIEAWRHAALDVELMKTVCAAPYLKRASSE